LKTIYIGGEKLSQSIVNGWTTNTRKVFNCYGPTEATIQCSGTEVSPSGHITVGSPYPGYSLHIVSPQTLSLKPDGEMGELIIAGDILARGYKNNSKKTSEKFIFHEGLGKRIYRSGDLASRQTNGKFQFNGRIDDQVKFHGRRFELSSVEYHVENIDHVKQACVCIQGDSMYAFILTDEEFSMSIEEMRKHLKKNIPIYMVPTNYIFLDSIPLTRSGKTDRKRLLEEHVNDHPKHGGKKQKIRMKMKKEDTRGRKSPMVRVNTKTSAVNDKYCPDNNTKEEEIVIKVE